LAVVAAPTSAAATASAEVAAPTSAATPERALAVTADQALVAASVVGVGGSAGASADVVDGAMAGRADAEGAETVAHLADAQGSTAARSGGARDSTVALSVDAQGSMVGRSVGARDSMAVRSVGAPGSTVGRSVGVSGLVGAGSETNYCALEPPRRH